MSIIVASNSPPDRLLVGLQRLAAERHKGVVTGEEVSDSDLLVLSRTRPELLGVVYERHAPAVYRYLGRRVGVGAAEDLLGTSSLPL